MRSHVFLATALFVSAQFICDIPKSQAAGLTWEVENPYRFFKRYTAFAVQEKAFDAVRGAPGGPLPANILWEVERRLNDPDCRNSATPAS